MAFIDYVNTFVDLLYPRHCFSCDIAITAEGEIYLCHQCKVEIKIIDENRCIRCGLPLGPYVSVSSKGCVNCKGLKLWFDAVYSIVKYEGAVRELIKRFKYGRNETLSIPLSKILIEGAIKGIDVLGEIDIIAPVPLFWFKKIKRGFNQVELMSRKLSKQLSIPISTRNLIRIKNTASQTHLSRQQRLENIQDAFKIKRPQQFLGKKVLLVDDVMTTGITLSECAWTLKKAGAKRVYGLTLARAKMD